MHIIPLHRPRHGRSVAGRGVSRLDYALAQRAELHLDLPDSALIELALRSSLSLAVAR